jgi:rubrerythrin
MNVQNIWTCKECGHSSLERFENDICPHCRTTSWRCAQCGFMIVAKSAPSPCPECRESSHFVNMTCYIPDWGATENYQMVFPE